MKKFVIILGIIVSMLWAYKVWANPFLVCSPSSEDITHFLLKWDGAEAEQATAFDLGDNTVMLKYDLKDLPDGTHHVEVAARNLWGMSIWVPFDFRSGSPKSPQGIGLSLE